MDEARRVSPPTIAGLAIAFLLVASYSAGYWGLSRHSPGATPDDHCRIFRAQWLATIYQPAAKVEGALTGKEVSTWWMP